jgi:hypothetical protein
MDAPCSFGVAKGALGIPQNTLPVTRRVANYAPLDIPVQGEEERNVPAGVFLIAG